MATVTPYLMLDGKAREAMNFYKSCLGGDLQIMTYADAQGNACPIAMKDQVMHSALKSGDFLLMASDGNPEMKAKQGDNVCLALNCTSAAEIERLFKALSEGGEVKYPLHDAFWGGKFGVLVDRYGIHWMLNYEKK